MGKFEEFYPKAVNRVWDKYGKTWAIDYAADGDCNYAGQCVSLIKSYLIYLYGNKNVRDTYGHAIQYWTHRNTNGILDLCDPASTMQDGDIVVTNGTDPQYGHIFIYRQGAAFTQNFNGDPRATVQPLAYQGDIQGVLRPKAIDQEVNEAKMYGLDLSYANGAVDMNTVKADGNTFVILRAGYGWSVDNKDVTFEANYRNAKAAGLRVGCYWFSYATNEAQARAEAECFKQVIAGKEFDFGVWIDLEPDPWITANGNPSGEQRAAYTNLIAQEMTKAGYSVGIYASTSLIDNTYKGLDIKNFHLWEANYGLNDDRVYSDHSGRAVIHQYTSRHCINGKYFDRNICYTDCFKEMAFEEKPVPIEREPGWVYRLYNEATGDHLYTQNFTEVKSVVDAGWLLEDDGGWKAPDQGLDVYRLYSDGKHTYAYQSEAQALEKTGWRNEGVAFRSGGSNPIYRLYNPNSGAHVLSINRKEHDALSHLGWYCEGQEMKY